MSDCQHQHTRPATVDDERPYCVSCKRILTSDGWKLLR